MYPWASICFVLLWSLSHSWYWVVHLKMNRKSSASKKSWHSESKATFKMIVSSDCIVDFYLSRRCVYPDPRLTLTIFLLSIPSYFWGSFSSWALSSVVSELQESDHHLHHRVVGVCHNRHVTNWIVCPAVCLSIWKHLCFDPKRTVEGVISGAFLYYVKICFLIRQTCFEI